MQKIIVLFLSLTLLSFTPNTTQSKFTHKTDFVENVATNGGFSRYNFTDSLQSLYQSLQLENAGLSFDAFNKGMIGFYTLKNEGKVGEKNLLSIIDFNQASTKKRFYTIDLDARKLLFHTYVSHGKNTGENFATSFSNTPHSNQSSLGFYLTAETYVGSKGYSLRLDGMEKGYNNNVRKRAVVIHSAKYVSEYWINRYGRLGRSQGCPALPVELSKTIIDSIKNKTVVFGYFNDENYLKSSTYLDFEKMIIGLEAKSELASMN